jgi:hypothetical protein
MIDAGSLEDLPFLLKTFTIIMPLVSLLYSFNKLRILSPGQKKRYIYILNDLVFMLR